mgnify:CR=1 FL=1
MTNNIFSKIIKIFVAIIFFYVIYVIIGQLMKINSNKESFLNYGEYPLAVDNPILFDTYKVQDNPGVTSLSASDIYKDYPIYPAHSLKTTNIRYWDTPDDGECRPPEMCGGLYKKTPQVIPPPVEAPKWDNQRRVNFYVYEDSQEH